MHDRVHRAPSTLPGDTPLVEDRLFDLQLKFNLLPALYAHPSWIDRLTVDALGSPAPSLKPVVWRPVSAFATRRLSVRLLDAHGINGLVDFDFSDRGKRLALLGGEQLVEVAALTSAVVLRDRLRTLVRAEQVAHLQRTMGAPVHGFALRWQGQGGPELPPAVLEAVGSGLSPQAEPGRWRSGALRLLLSAIPPLALAVWRRLRLKLPSDWMAPLLPWRLRETQRLALADLATEVVRQALPGHAWLLADAALETTHRTLS
ncbi:Yop proteins translocation protein K [Aquabacterium sp. A7-Y]|uniref:SctK family type III secretion system sorting platform protein n=1 Tax=Aquabacterium sp. A7-Y TaxID=1349605 RepID=UPI00223E0A3E|nr:SctK family type III secretion system sorting platform protein [Aquabacterium sp. A7-Y]MCW7542113.1 Yop proteins translocation protein K [Aquabacterium sp. A7-Y]